MKGIPKGIGTLASWLFGGDSLVRTSIAILFLAACAGSPLVASAVTIDWVPVKGAGNQTDSNGQGAVGYDYKIDKYEVTNSQYTAFLNAVAATDTYGLYSGQTGTQLDGITQSGGPGNYSYSVMSGYANLPVNYISWADGARFANWLSNGQITGSEGLSTTESGSYFLNGAMTAAAISLVHRSATATAVIPTLDEWYKAAYYDPATNSYFRFPTSSNTIPSNSYADTGNNANFYVNLVGYTVGPPLYFTDVGHFAASASPNGTFDQGGNVWEWNETLINLEADKQLVFADGLDSA